MSRATDPQIRLPLASELTNFNSRQMDTALICTLLSKFSERKLITRNCKRFTALRRKARKCATALQSAWERAGG
jgi:hypothetical protein